MVTTRRVYLLMEKSSRFLFFLFFRTNLNLKGTSHFNDNLYKGRFITNPLSYFVAYIS